jgi:hypothetical protein
VAALERQGLRAACVASHEGPFGPAARAREAFLRERGLWPEDGVERLVVVAGERPVATRAAEVDGAAA